ncbi:MAG: AsmA family protein [Candidatus Anammoxibacter sp.]
MRKYIKIGGIAAAVLVLIAVVFISFFLDKTIKMAVETVGSGITKTQITLESVKLSIFSGSGELKGLVVGNPEGFNTPEAISMGHVKLDLSILSLFSDTIIIEEILVDGAEITYEASIKGSNFKTIMDNVESTVGGTTEDEHEQDIPEKDDSPKSAAKKMQINKLVFKNGKIHVSSKMFKGKVVTIPLPSIELYDIGKKSESNSNIFDKLKNLKGKKLDKNEATVQEMIASLFKAIFDTVISAVAESDMLGGKEIRKRIDEISSTVTNKGAAIKEDAVGKLKLPTKEKAAEAIDKLKGLFGK